MTAQTYTRTTEQPNSTVLSGDVKDIGIEFVSAFSDPTQPLTASAAHVAQTSLVSIAPASDMTVATGTPVSSVPTIQDSAFGGQVIYLVNFSNSGFSYTIQNDAILSGTKMGLNYNYRTLGPGMCLPLMLWGLFGQANFWREIGNMDDLPQGGITAHAGGGQFSATPLRHKRNIIDTVANSGDSTIMTVPLAFGMPIWATNIGANPTNMYPVIGSKLGGLAVDTPISIAVGKTIMVVPLKTGQYAYVLSA